MEQEAGSTDVSVRSQIQSESVQVGLVMQHLGALFLELGRTILMLQMGRSPVCALDPNCVAVITNLIDSFIYLNFPGFVCRQRHW